jgi:hydroxymethylpyrimidine/phosphomethylpyrimidine kinase
MGYLACIGKQRHAACGFSVAPGAAFGSGYMDGVTALSPLPQAALGAMRWHDDAAFGSGYIGIVPCSRCSICAPSSSSTVVSSRTMTIYNSRPVVLCLSGHDPSGGAGLQADIEALLAQGCHAAPTITALTVQNTVDVRDFRVLDRAWILAQAHAVLEDSPVAAVKLGMLGSSEMVDTVVELLGAHAHLPIVCDPVLRAGGGGSLGKDEVGYAMRERLLPLAIIATPNLPEARILAELPEGSADQCAEVLLRHCRNLLITGGHGDERQVHNRLYSRTAAPQTFTCERLPGSYHGSGCTLASALAGRLAQGEQLHSAVRTALDYTWRTLRDAERLGRGQYVPRRLPLDFSL